MVVMVWGYSTSQMEMFILVNGLETIRTGSENSTSFRMASCFNSTQDTSKIPFILDSDATATRINIILATGMMTNTTVMGRSSLSKENCWNVEYSSLTK